MGVVNIGGIAFNIYGEHTDNTGPVISATAYFSASLNVAGWDVATFGDRQKALVNAARIFDKQRWKGALTDPTTPQPLAWPRTGVADCDGVAIDPNTIPEDVIFASYELAAAILSNAAVQTQENTGSNVRRVLARKKVGDLEIEDETEYFTPTNIGLAVGSRFPAQVQEYLRCYVEGHTMGATVVGAAPSVFIDFDFGLTGQGNL